VTNNTRPLFAPFVTPLYSYFTPHVHTGSILFPSTYILALLNSNGADIQTIGLAVLIAKVKDINTASATRDEHVARLGDLGGDGFLFDHLDQSGTGDTLVPGMDVAAPELIPAVYLSCIFWSWKSYGREENERWRTVVWLVSLNEECGCLKVKVTNIVVASI
jgi:hypothetical protein